MECMENSHGNFNSESIHFRIHDFSFWLWLVQVGFFEVSFY